IRGGALEMNAKSPTSFTVDFSDRKDGVSKQELGLEGLHPALFRDYSKLNIMAIINFENILYVIKWFDQPLQRIEPYSGHRKVNPKSRMAFKLCGDYVIASDEKGCLRTLISI